jgi:hypothetical protein
MNGITPPKGTMYLFDNITPPLEDGSYRITANSTVAYTGGNNPSSSTRYFDIVGPRFALAPTDVGGLFPPRDAHGGFSETLAHMAIKRRTLPWERVLSQHVPVPTHHPDDPPSPDGPVPWVALLLFEEGEYQLLTSVPLENVVPTDVFTRLGSPQNITCDAVETDLATLKAIIPSVEELQLLAHVRLVNVEDRELNAAGGDGYYSVVVSNRLPTPGAKCRAVLVSLEERLDLVTADPPPEALGISRVGGVAQSAVALSSSRFGSETNLGGFGGFIGYVHLESVRLVALYTWPFTCEGTATFRELMQALDVAMIGNVRESGHPQLTDTGHLRLHLSDRAGSQEITWYRGPLVPYQLTRDPLGPYHSADQARRATPETGAEDISYACAFEVGRLLGVADARFARELMHWRREAYHQSARASTIAAVQNRFPLDLGATLTQQLHVPLTPIVATAALGRVALGAPTIADPYGIAIASNAIGFNPVRLQGAWNLASTAEAGALLGGDAGALGATVAAVPQSVRNDVTIDDVAADATSLTRLSELRTIAIANITERTGDA